MLSDPLRAFGEQTYCQSGNVLGYDKAEPARISDEYRRYNPVHITGAEADRTQWTIEQVLQDLSRQNLVVLRDPKGLATAEIIARIDKAYLKNTVWIDLDNPERLTPLCPFPNRQPDEIALVSEWEAAFLDSLAPLSNSGARSVKRLLQLLYAADGTEPYVRPCLSNFWQMVVVNDYRRLLLSHVPTAFWGLMPDGGELRDLQQEIGPKLAEIFAVNRWRGMLALPDPPENRGWTKALRSHPNKQVGFIAITGAKALTDPVVQTALNFALWRKITAWQTSRGGLPVYAYSLASDFFASPAIKPLLHGSPAPLSVTCVHNQPQGWLNYEFFGHLSRNGKRIMLEDSRGHTVSLKRNPALPEPNYTLSKISRKYSAMGYARKAEFCLVDQQALFGKPDRLPELYGALGEAPPHFMTIEQDQSGGTSRKYRV